VSLFFRRLLALIILVITINLAWHFFRAWLPLFLQEDLGYSEGETAGFLTLYYVAADLGSLSAGVATLYVIRRGLPVHQGRSYVFLGYAVLTATACLAAFLPGGPLLVVVFLVVAFGSLGVFPNYYSFSQELTVRHQGKMTGFLGWTCWMAMGLMQAGVGNFVQAYHSYRVGIALAGLMPLIGFAALVLLWGKTPMVHHIQPEDEAALPSKPGTSGVAGRFFPGSIVPAADGQGTPTNVKIGDEE
jgi:ACS family hexuronate transporter-like MFS transporter